MANLTETDVYPAGIYQLEQTDPVLGGAPNEATGAGMDNIPHQQLAKRTKWLKTRVDQLLSTVVAATTAVAGIVQLSTSTNSTSTTTAATPSAVKSANDNAETRALKATTISADGLATGGGNLSANRTISVPVATWDQTVAGTDNATAMTPLRVAQALVERLSMAFYVDSTYGDDTAVGTDALPLKSVAEAVRRCPPGSHATIFLKRSAVLAENVKTRARTILIRSAVGVSPALKSDWWQDPANGLWRPGQIEFYGVAGSLIFNEIGVQFGARAAGTRADQFECGLVMTNGLTAPAFVGFAASSIYRFAGADGFLLSSAAGTGTINLTPTVTYSGMDGWWCAGVAAGTARTATRYNTNLTTL